MSKYPPLILRHQIFYEVFFVLFHNIYNYWVWSSWSQNVNTIDGNEQQFPTWGTCTLRGTEKSQGVRQIFINLRCHKKPSHNSLRGTRVFFFLLGGTWAEKRLGTAGLELIFNSMWPRYIEYSIYFWYWQILYRQIIINKWNFSKNKTLPKRSSTVKLNWQINNRQIKLAF